MNYGALMPVQSKPADNLIVKRNDASGSSPPPDKFEQVMKKTVKKEQKSETEQVDQPEEKVQAKETKDKAEPVKKKEKPKETPLADEPKKLEEKPELEAEVQVENVIVMATPIVVEETLPDLENKGNEQIQLIKEVVQEVQAVLDELSLKMEVGMITDYEGLETELTQELQALQEQLTAELEKANIPFDQVMEKILHALKDQKEGPLQDMVKVLEQLPLQGTITSLSQKKQDHPVKVESQLHTLETQTALPKEKSILEGKEVKVEANSGQVLEQEVETKEVQPLKATIPSQDQGQMMNLETPKTETLLAEPVVTATKELVAMEKNVFDQLLSGTKSNLVLKADGAEMTMKLKPEHLGEVSLKVEIHKGEVIAKFEVESMMVKEVVESQFNELKDALQQKGFSITSLQVNISNQQKQFSNRQRQNQTFKTVDVSKIDEIEAFSLEDRLEGVSTINMLA